MRRLTSAVLCLLTAALPACGDKASGMPDIPTTIFAALLGVNLGSMTHTPTGLYYKDLVIGTGPVVANFQLVSIHYTGDLPNGTQFDANNAPAAPFTFQLGGGQVIPGFDQGVSGMHVGGRRQIVIPPALGYGAQAIGPIPPNSILVFTIDVVAAQ